MSSDGPEQRMADAREEYERDQDYKDAHEEDYETWLDRQIDRADFARDCEREWDRAVKSADVFGEFLDKLTGGK